MHRLLPGDPWGAVVAERCGNQGSERFYTALFLWGRTGRVFGADGLGRAATLPMVGVKVLGDTFDRR